MYTISDDQMDEQLARPLVLLPVHEAPAATAAPRRTATCVNTEDGLPAPWQVPLPDEREWQIFLREFLDQLRDNEQAVKAVLAAIKTIKRGTTQPEPSQ
jgi:non-ribosomal peptide synthetase component F